MALRLSRTGSAVAALLDHAAPEVTAAAAALGRLGGSANTRKQQRARKRNAQFAGRPRRVCATCGEPVKGGHADTALDLACGAHGWRWQQGSQRPTHAVVPSFAQLRAVITTTLTHAPLPPAVRAALVAAARALAPTS